MPNPATDFIQIEAKDGSRVSLFNSLGVLIKEETITDETLQLNVSGLPEGVYIVEIKNGEKISTTKVIVQ
jgi:hypothetical protein